MRQAEADLPQCLFIDRFLGRGWCCGVSPSAHIDSRASASVPVQRMDADATWHIGYYAQQIPPAYYRLVRRSRDRTQGKSKNLATAVRMFLRFLIARARGY